MDIVAAFPKWIKDNVTRHDLTNFVYETDSFFFFLFSVPIYYEKGEGSQFLILSLFSGVGGLLMDTYQ